MLYRDPCNWFMPRRFRLAPPRWSRLRSRSPRWRHTRGLRGQRTLRPPGSTRRHRSPRRQRARTRHTGRVGRSSRPFRIRRNPSSASRRLGPLPARLRLRLPSRRRGRPRQHQRRCGSSRRNPLSRAPARAHLGHSREVGSPSGPTNSAASGQARSATAKAGSRLDNAARGPTAGLVVSVKVGSPATI